MKKNTIKASALAVSICMLCSALTSCGSAESPASEEPKKDDYSYSNSTPEYEDDALYEAAPAGDEYYGGYYEEYPVMPSPDEEYDAPAEGGFKDPKAEPLSTFSADVDTASYTNVRRLIEDGSYIPEDAVRAEEFINYFDYDYPDPEEGKFSQYVEIGDCPWDASHKLIMVGLQGKRMEKAETPPSNLVFLIDSSGSMDSYDKLPLVQNAFSMLAENLTEKDRISIVTYAGSSSTLIKGASGKDKDDILEALYSIDAAGSTNGEGGINTAYELAEKYFIEGGNNRVILATDGDLNVGASSTDELTELIESKRDKGIYLSVLGFGTGNYKDARMEALADNGNGNYSYIDSVDEAHRVLVEEMSGTLYTIAKDVKIQVEFNPSQVSSYRLIGYDNRLMEAEDFYDETKDAGEVGAGHSVTALYEVELVSDEGTYHGIDLEFADQHAQPLENKTEKDNERTELCKLSLTYKDTDTNEDIYDSQLFGMEKYSKDPSDRLKLAGAAAEFAMILKDSEYKGSSDYSYVRKTAEALSGSSEKAAELAELAETASSLFS